MTKTITDPNNHTAEYERLYGKPVPNFYKNNKEWVTQKVDEARTSQKKEKKEEIKKSDEKRKKEAGEHDFARVKQEGQKAHVYIAGEYIRTYSLDEHGHKFLELAEGFATKQKKKHAEESLKRRGFVL